MRRIKAKLRPCICGVIREQLATFKRLDVAMMNTNTQKKQGTSDVQNGPNYMAIDQYGNTYHNLGQYPRKALLERLNAKRASKMYVGDSIHVGYVISGLWLNLYEVRPFHEIAEGK